jgi:hypothetical protein
MEATPILRLEVVQYIAIPGTGTPPSERSPEDPATTWISVVMGPWEGSDDVNASEAPSR